MAHAKRIAGEALRVRGWEGSDLAAGEGDAGKVAMAVRLQAGSTLTV